MMTIQQALETIHQQIQTSTQLAHRPESAVTLLAVSKTKPNEAILEAYQAGQKAFGENYVQEGVDKIQYFEGRNIQLEWHFIGPLQSNKTRLVAEHFDWMQTLERAKIADRLNEQRPANKAPLNVLIQINISDEASKSGIQPSEMIELAKHIENLPHFDFVLPFISQPEGKKIGREPWHISYLPLAEQASRLFTPDVLLQVWQHEIVAGKETLIEHLPEIFEQYVV